MLCPMCNYNSVKGKNLTCGSSNCVTKMAQRTRAENDDGGYAERKRMYGKDNPWVQWEHEQSTKES